MRGGAAHDKGGQRRGSVIAHGMEQKRGVVRVGGKTSVKKTNLVGVIDGKRRKRFS